MSVSTKNSKQWHASLTVWRADPESPAGGRWARTWRATGVPSTEPRSKAEKVARALQDGADLVRPDNLRRGDSRSFTIALETIWRAAGVEPPQQSLTWKEFVPQFLKTADVNKKSLAMYQSYLDRFTQHLGVKAHGMMHNITHANCQSFYEAVLKTGITLKTARNYMKCVRAVFDRAVKLGIIPLNPAVLVKTPIGAAALRLPLSLPEIEAVLAVIDNPPEEAIHCRGFLFSTQAEWKTAVLLGLWCGMRLGDATSMRWSNFDFGEMTVRFIPQKKSRYGVPVTLPLVGTLKAHLESLPRSGEFLTPVLRGGTKNSVQFGKLLDLAGVSDEKPDSMGAAGKPKRLKSFHSLRHTVLTLLAKSGADKQIRMLLADHDDPAVNDKYTHAQVERLAEALGRAFTC